LTESVNDDTLYWEKDETSPNIVIYDLENNETIIPQSEEEILPQTQIRKVISRNVSTQRRRFR
jgi:hypothetical protein